MNSLLRRLASALLLVLLTVPVALDALATAGGVAGADPVQRSVAVSGRSLVSLLPEGTLPVVLDSLSAGLPPAWHITAVPAGATQPAGYRASNSQQQLHYDFTDEGLQIQPADLQGEPGWKMQFALHAYGYEGATRLIEEAAAIRVADTRIEYHYPDRSLTEWYVNSPLGLEHGYTVHKSPTGQQDSNYLVLELALADDLAATLEADRRSVTFSTLYGERVLSYGGLYANDASGRHLPAEMRLDGERLVLRVAVTDAAYPLTIDPLFQSELKYTSPGAAIGEQFGWSVAIDGDWMVIGSPEEDDSPYTKAGVAYVYQRQGDSTWVVHQKLAGGDFSGYTNQNDSAFGYAVAISGNRIVIGAPEHDGAIDPVTDAGLAFVYERNTSGCSVQCWQAVQALEATGNVNPDDNFGYSVDIKGNTLVVGAPYDEKVVTDEGAAYVFESSQGTWIRTAHIGPDLGGNATDIFGTTVSVTDNYIAVGAPQDDDGGAEAGAVFVFNRSTGWQQEFKIPGLAANEYFGYSVDMDGGRLVAGAPLAMDNGLTYAGVARIYTRYKFIGQPPVWGLPVTITPMQADNTTLDSEAGDYFGLSVSISREAASGGADYVTAGSYYGGAGDDRGAAYLYRDDGGWAQLKKLVASDGMSQDRFGGSVAVDGETVVVGAKDNDQAGLNSGSAYVFGSLVSASLSLDLSTHAIQVGNQIGSVQGTLHAGGVPAPNSVLAGRTLSLFVTDPTDTTVVVPAVTDSYGKVTFPLGNLTMTGTYTLKAWFPGTSTWAATETREQHVQVSSHAGYLMIIEGSVYPAEQGDEPTHYKFANRLYQAAVSQRSFTDDHIFYLAQSASVPRPGMDGKPLTTPQIMGYLLETDPVNGTGSLAEQLILDPGPVHIVMVDHGAIDPGTEEGLFYLNDSGEVMRPVDVDYLLTQLESLPDVSNWPRTVTVLTCYSGSFIQELANPHVPGRVIVTSTLKHEESFKGLMEQDGVRSGSYFGEEIFRELFRGRSFKDAFMLANERTGEYTRANDSSLLAANQYNDNARQHPLLDDNGGEGTNTLSDVATLDGWVARDVYLGIGTWDDNYYISSVSPTQYLPTVGVACLNLTPIHTTVITAASIAIRPPNTLLPAASGISGQLDTPYISMPMTDMGSHFEICPDFNIPGKWEVWIIGEDSQGQVTQTEHVVVYVDDPANSTPGTINLLSPIDGSEGRTNQSFDWDPVTDPDGDAVTYRLLISETNFDADNNGILDPSYDADSDGILDGQYIYYSQEGLRSSRAHLNTTANLEDLTTYYWQILAIDRYGSRQGSDIWSFRTNNRNFIGTRLVGRVTSSSVGLEGALVELFPGAGLSDEYGDYVLDDLPIGPGTATASLSNYSDDEVEVAMYAARDTTWNPGLAPDCSPVLGSTSQTGIDAAGSQGNTVTVIDASGNCNWTAASNSPGWIVVTSGDSLEIHTGSGTVSYDVSPNPGESIRNGTISIAGQTFTISQNAAMDTDGDGIMNWMDTDDDNDGLSDTDEINIHDTNPLLTDSDGDSYDDYFEVYDAGSDPTVFDPTWGDIDGNRYVDVVDVMFATRTVFGLYTPYPDQVFRGNIAPLVEGVPSPSVNDSDIGVADLLLIQRKALNPGLF